MIHANHTSKKGFALLITLLTVGVIVSATLAIVELSRMQLKLSVDSRDAEIAFSAANAAKECAQYIRTTSSSTISVGQNIINTECLGGNVRVIEVPAGFPIEGVASNVYRYQYEIDWEASGSDRCSAVDMIAIYARTDDITIGTNGSPLSRYISNYRTNRMICVQGSECTIIAAAGYNSTCANRNNDGVLKREVLLEF